MRSDTMKTNLFALTLLGLLTFMAVVILAQPALSQSPAEPIPVVLNEEPDHDPGLIGSGLTDVATPTVSIEVSDGNASEAGPNRGVFTVTRSRSYPPALTVNYTVGGTATEGDDYQALSGSVNLGAGSPVANIVVTPIDDTLVEGDETVIITLLPGAGYKLGDDTAAIVIRDNDPTPSPTPTPTPAPEVRIAENHLGRPWLYLWKQTGISAAAQSAVAKDGGVLFMDGSTTGDRIVFFHLEAAEGRIHRGGSVTGEALYTVDFTTGRIFAGPNKTGPLLYTLNPNPFSQRFEVRVHEGSTTGPVLYTIDEDDMHLGPNLTGPLVYHGSRPFRGPVQFLLPLLADGRIP